MGKREGQEWASSQLEGEKRPGPDQPPPLARNPSSSLSVLSSPGPPVRPRWLSILCQRDLTHLIKVSNEQLCIFLNYRLNLLGDGLKWDFHVFPHLAYGEPASPSGLR